MKLSSASWLVVLPLALASCEGPVGYRGPLPSADARRTLGALEGAALPAGSVAFTARELVVRAFLVRPQGPAVIVEEARAGGGPASGMRFWIPVLTDGDVADLHRLAGRETPPALGGELSDVYRRYVRGE